MIKKISLYLTLTFAIGLFIGLDTLDAQNRRSRNSTDEYFDESGNFGHRLWYGGNINLWLVNSAFNIGITPMIGYKVLEQVSFGPRFTIDYYQEKLRTNVNTTVNYRSTTWGVGLFGRAKVFQNFFAHIEAEYQNTAVPSRTANGSLQLDPDDQDEVLTQRINDNNFYIGAGYNSSAGGLFGYEIMILFNTTEGDNSERLPWDLRFGFTYNF